MRFEGGSRLEEEGTFQLTAGDAENRRGGVLGLNRVAMATHS